jgi:hypothetical protein
MGTLKDNRQGVENEGPDKAPVAHYAPKSKVVTNNVPIQLPRRNGKVLATLGPRRLWSTRAKSIRQAGLSRRTANHGSWER